MSIVIRSAPRKALIAFFVVTLFSSATARAQDQRLRISFAPSVATVSGDAALALDGSLGYRFSRHLWFEGDVTWIDAAAGGFRNRDLLFDQRALNELGLAESLRRGAMFGHGRFAGLPALPTLPADIGQLHASTDGSTTVGTLGVRYEITGDTERFRPYLTGGLGINHTDQTLSMAATSVTSAIDESTSHTGFAFSGGGGASIRLAGQLWADADAKYFRLSDDRNVMRLGGGISFRF